MTGIRRMRVLFAAVSIPSALFLAAGCEKKVTGRSDDDRVNVAYPLGLKCVYASAGYADRVDSTGLLWMKIFSIQYDSTRLSGDTLFYLGRVFRTVSFPSYPPAPIPLSPGGIVPAGPDSGRLVVTVDRKWVQYQYCGIADGYEPFLKSARRSGADADTMAFPTEFFGQTPVYPAGPKPYGRYDAIRPSGGTTGSLQRTFIFEGIRTWTGPFDSGQGLFFSVRHTLFETTAIDMIGIMDSHGIVASQYSTELPWVTPQDPATPVDTLTYYQLNRRLVDFSDPATVKPLSWYADRVMRDGLESLEQPEETR
jgi:hypothetical protein